MLGYEDNGIENDLEEWFSRVHPEDTERAKAAIAAHREGLTAHYENEYRMLHKDSSYRWMLSRGLAIRDGDGKALRMAGSQTDITEGKVADPLTGLPNRLLFLDRLGCAMERAKRRSDYLFAVLFLDVDRFKVINDSLGHMIGDQLLVAISRRLEGCLRSGDTVARLGEGHTVARLGGDEFTILLEDFKDVGNVTTVADRVQKELNTPFILGGHEVFSSLSIGIALSTTGYDKREDMVRDADTALYEAKRLGRARYAMFDQSMRVRAISRLQLEVDLRRAVERGEFLLHYQPIILLETGMISGFEALLRWQHPERGIVSPDEFVSLAEETGLIVSIGQWVLREACHQLCKWHEQFRSIPPLTISVNLSCKEFVQPFLLEQVVAVLTETGLSPHSLKLEITESVLMERADSIIDTLSQLKELGIHLGIDDFGTGYSSLSYLPRLPVDTLKIDRSFISKMDSDLENAEIVQSITALSRNLDMTVVAEGVETAGQLAQLRALRCEYGQGYYFSKPVESTKAEALIAAQLQNCAEDDFDSVSLSEVICQQ